MATGTHFVPGSPPPLLPGCPELGSFPPPRPSATRFTPPHQSEGVSQPWTGPLTLKQTSPPTCGVRHFDFREKEQTDTENTKAKFTTLTLCTCEVLLRGIKDSHSPGRPSPLSALELSHLVKLKLCPHQTLAPHLPLSSPLILISVNSTTLGASHKQDLRYLPCVAGPSHSA